MRAISIRILKIAAPMTAARFVNMFSVFFGMMMVAHLGRAALAASALISSSYFTVLVIFMFVLFSVGVVSSRYYGEQRYFEIGGIVQQGGMLACLLAVPMTMSFYMLPDFLKWAHQNPQLVRYATQFFRPLIFLPLPMLLVTCVSQFMLSVMRVHHVVVAYVLGIIVFVVVAELLIFGHGGFPAWGMVGFATALLTQEIVMLLYLLLCYLFDRSLHCYQLFRLRQYEWRTILLLWQIGWPMSVQFGGELLGFFVITLCVGWLGVTDLAAWQVVQQVTMIFIVPIFSFSEALAMVVGHVVGAKEYALVPTANRVGMLLAWVWVALTMSLFILFPDKLMQAYLRYQQGSATTLLAHTISLLFLINAFLYLCDSCRNLISGSLRGLYDTRFAMVTGIVVVWGVGVCMGSLLAFGLRLGVFGFAIAQASGFFVGACVVWLRWQRQVKKLTAVPAALCTIGVNHTR